MEYHDADSGGVVTDGMLVAPPVIVGCAVADVSPRDSGPAAAHDDRTNRTKQDLSRTAVMVDDLLSVTVE